MNIETGVPDKNADAIHYVVVLTDADGAVIPEALLYVDGRQVAQLDLNGTDDEKEAFYSLANDTAEMYNTRLQEFQLTDAQAEEIASRHLDFTAIDWGKAMEICKFQPIMLQKKTIGEEIAETLLQAESADIWYDAGRFADIRAAEMINRAKEAMQTAAALLSNRDVDALAVGQCRRLPMAHSGQNRHGYVMEVARTGDTSVYDEFRVSVLDTQGECVADVLVGLNEEGEPRVLVTADGAGDDDHPIAVYPLRSEGQAVMTGWDQPAPQAGAAMAMR